VEKESWKAGRILPISFFPFPFSPFFPLNICHKTSAVGVFMTERAVSAKK
jgi:hypothetical protein